MQMNSPFAPIGDTVNLVVTASSGVLALPAIGNFQSLRLVNIGTQTVFVKFGISSTTATVAAGLPLLPGVIEVFDIGNSVTHVAAIAAATGSTLYCTLGYGN